MNDLGESDEKLIGTGWVEMNLKKTNSKEPDAHRKLLFFLLAM